MFDRIKHIRVTAIDGIKASISCDELEQLRVRFLGKKGELTGILKELGSLSAEERKYVGTEANNLKKKISDLLADKEKELSSNVIQQTIGKVSDFDFTLFYNGGAHNPLKY